MKDTIKIVWGVTFTRKEIEHKYGKLTDGQWEYVKNWMEDASNWMEVEIYKGYLGGEISEAIKQAEKRG